MGEDRLGCITKFTMKKILTVYYYGRLFKKTKFFQKSLELYRAAWLNKLHSIFILKRYSAKYTCIQTGLTAKLHHKYINDKGVIDIT